MEQVITKVGKDSKKAATEAWNILKNRSNIEPIRLLRIADSNIDVPEIKSKAAKVLHTKIEEIEARAEDGDEDSQKFLENWGDIEGLKSRLLEKSESTQD